MSGAGAAAHAATLSTALLDFSASAACGHETIAAFLSGTADLGAKAGLDDFLTSLHDMAYSRRVAEVVVDFRNLKFMNSSCLKGLVTWICRVSELPPESQYRIALVSSPEMHWQRRSLHALSCLAPHLVTFRS